MKENNESGTSSSSEKNDNAAVEPDERNVGIVHVDNLNTTSRASNQPTTSSSVDNAQFAQAFRIDSVPPPIQSQQETGQPQTLHGDISQMREVHVEIPCKTAKSKSQQKKGKRLKKFANVVALQLENNENNDSLNVVINLLCSMVQFRERVIDNLSKYRKSEPEKRSLRLLAELFSGQTKNVTEFGSHLEGLKRGEQDVTKVFEIIVESLLNVNEECLEFRTNSEICVECTGDKAHTMQYDTEYDYSTVLNLDDDLCTFQELFEKNQISSGNCEKCSVKKIVDPGKFHVVSITKNDPNSRFDLDTTETVAMFEKQWRLIAFGELKFGNSVSWIKTKSCWLCLSDSPTHTSVDVESMNLKNYNANILVFKRPGSAKGFETKKKKRKNKCEETRNENKKNNKLQKAIRKKQKQPRNKEEIVAVQEKREEGRRLSQKPNYYESKEKLRDQANANLPVKIPVSKMPDHKNTTVKRHKPEYDKVSPDKLVAKFAVDNNEVIGRRRAIRLPQFSTKIVVNTKSSNRKNVSSKRHKNGKGQSLSGPSSPSDASSSEDNDDEKDISDINEDINKDIAQSDTPTVANRFANRLDESYHSSSSGECFDVSTVTEEFQNVHIPETPANIQLNAPTNDRISRSETSEKESAPKEEEEASTKEASTKEEEKLKPTEFFTLESPFSDRDAIEMPIHNEGVLIEINRFLKVCLGGLIENLDITLPPEECDIDDIRDSIKKVSQKFKLLDKKLTAKSYFESKTEWEDLENWFIAAERISELAYALAVDDSNKLSIGKKGQEVYGEMRVKQMKMIIKKYNIGPDDIFLDLGSGIGQLVCFTAGFVHVKKVIGIEFLEGLTTYAVDIERFSIALMKFIGRDVSPIKLIKGSFLDKKHRKKIQKEATLIFANNFKFDPDTNDKLRGFFTKCKDGTRILSTEEFMFARLRNSHGIAQMLKVPICEGNFTWKPEATTIFGVTINKKAAKNV